VTSESKENPLLEFLLLPSFEDSRSEIPLIMKNIEFSLIAKKDLLLGDLYHAYFLGISNELEFNIRQYHYQSAIKQGIWNACARTGWINQIYLEIFMKKLDSIEGRLALEPDKATELEQQKASTLDLISKTKKNYYSSFSILKKKPQFKYSEEYLRFLLENTENLLPKDKADKTNCLTVLRLLKLLGRDNVLSDLFTILTIKKKSDPGNNNETHEEMKKIAVKLKGKSNREICYCMEKNIGFERNLSKIFQYYHDEIFLFFEDFNKLRYCLFRVGKLLERMDKEREFAGVFFEICLLKLVLSLKTELSFENLYYLAKIYRRPTFSKDLNYSTGILLFIQDKLATKSHLDFPNKILLFEVNRKLQVLKSENTMEKLNFTIILNKEIKNLEEKLSKAVFYDYFIKDDLASFINQTFRTFLIKLDEKVQIERTLSPNLRYKKSLANSNEPEFGPFVMKRLKKLEQFSHVFQENELILQEAYNESTDNRLTKGLIKKNNQIIAVKDFVFRMDEIDQLIDFLNRLEFYLKINCKGLLSLIGFSYIKNSDKTICISVVFEGFFEFLISSLKNANKIEAIVELTRLIVPMNLLEKSSIYPIGFCIDRNFVVNSEKHVLFADFELNLLYKDQKSFIDIASQEKILNFLEFHSPPELFKSFSLRSEMINLTNCSVWSLAWVLIDILLKFKPAVNKDQVFPLEKASLEKLEPLIKDLLANEQTIKIYHEFLKKALAINDRTMTIKLLCQELKLESTKTGVLLDIEDTFLSNNLFKNIQFLNTTTESATNKGVFYLVNKGLYEGEVKDYSPNGTGVFSVRSVAYEGKFEKGRLEGYGRYRSNEWEMLYDGKFSENIARHGVIHLVMQKNKENSFENHGYTEFEKEFYLPNSETIGKMLEGFEDQSGFLEKIKNYRGYFDGFLKNKDKYHKICDFRGNVLYYKDENMKEFIVRKLELIDNFVIIFNETISMKEVFYFDQMSFGLFNLEKHMKSPLSFSPQLFESPLSGQLISYFGRKISGSFLDFKPLFGYKFNNFLNFTSFNNLQLIYQGTLKLIKDGKRDYNGSIINEKANGYGEETFNDNYIYKGFYKENEPYGKGVLQEKSGKALIKGFFKKGLPIWGTYHKDREVKYKGNFSFSQEGSIFSFKSIKQLLDSMVIKGFLIKNDEKILAQYGTFQRLDEELISGTSKIEYKNGVIFEGNLEKSLKKGKGTLTIKKGPNDVILAYGDWDNNKLKGVIKWDKINEYENSSGSFTFIEGGNTNNNANTTIPIMEGFGLIGFRNGSEYAGGFIENKMQGVGTFFEGKIGEKGERKSQFFGEFDDGKRSGFGVLKENKRSGFGVLKENIKENENDFLVYKGKFKNNEKNGYGLVYKKDEKYLEGLFVDGSFKCGWLYVNDKVIEKVEAGVFEYIEAKDLYIPKGFGTIYLKDGNKVECFLDNIVEDINEKKLKRIGILITETGGFYEGLIDMFKIHGFGSYRNGAKMLYEGEFKYGMFQGFGRIYDKKGRFYQGGFEKGLKTGFGLEVDENEENAFKGYWKNGVREGFGKIGRNMDEKKEEFFVMCQGLKINKIVKI